MFLVFLCDLHQRVVIVLADSRRAVFHGFAASIQVLDNVLRSGSTGSVIIKAQDNVDYVRVVCKKRIQCSVIRTAQRQIVNTAPISSVLHDFERCA